MNLKNKISGKIKGAFADAFNQEKRITSRFINHTRFLAKNSESVEGILSLQILESQDVVSASLCKGKTVIKGISLDTIALFFTDQMTASLISGSLVEQKLKKYFQNFQKNSDTHTIGVRVVILKNEIVKIYTLGTQETKEVSLTEFIHFFKS